MEHKSNLSGCVSISPSCEKNQVQRLGRDVYLLFKVFPLLSQVQYKQTLVSVTMKTSYNLTFQCESVCACVSLCTCAQHHSIYSPPGKLV